MRPTSVVDKVLLATTVASVVGLVALGALAEATKPQTILLSEVAEFADRTVTVAGRVLALEPLLSGSQRLALTDGNASLAVFLREPMGLFAGDVVEATGRVARYHGLWELVVEDADDVRLVTPWSENRIPVSVLAQEPWSFRGTNVRTSGMIESSRLPFFILDVGTDDRLRLGGLEDATYLDGAIVELTGVLEYDPEGNLFRLRVDEVLSSSPGA